MLTILRGALVASLLAVATLSGGVAQAQAEGSMRAESMQTYEDKEFPWGLLGLLGLAGLAGLKRRERELHTGSTHSAHASPVR
jgi:hypothetical protein